MPDRLSTDGGTGLGGFVDALGQSFIVDRNLFLTKIDIYFAQKSEEFPVELSIRPLENGVPSQTIIPNSVVTLLPSQVTTSTTSNTATSFTFNEPIFLESGIYSFVLTSDTKKYLVYVSEKGQADLITGAAIGAQGPFGGVLFKTQNGVSWEQDNTKDIKYRIYRANFTTTAATVDLKLRKGLDDRLTYKILPTDPFTSYATSPVLKVSHPYHGFTSGAKVKFLNIPSELAQLANANTVVTFNGIPRANLDPGTYFTVSNVRPDSYTVVLTLQAGDLANVTGGSFGGKSIAATSQHPYSTIYPAVSVLEPTGTAVVHRAKTVDSSYNESSFDVIDPDTYNFKEQKIIVDSENSSVQLANDESFVYRLSLSTTDSYVSPKIDFAFSSVNFITNNINKPDEETGHVLDKRTIINANTLISFATTGVVTVGGSVEQANVKTMLPGAFVTITGSGSNNGTYRIVSVASDGTTFTIPTANTEAPGSSVTMVYDPTYVAEEASVNTSAKAKYITRKIELANPSTAIVMRFAATVPLNAYVKVYYKTQSAGEEATIDSKEYTELDIGTIPASATGEYTEVEKVLENITSFTAVIFKIVLLSTNTASIPKVKDLRIIALE